MLTYRNGMNDMFRFTVMLTVQRIQLGYRTKDEMTARLRLSRCKLTCCQLKAVSRVSHVLSYDSDLCEIVFPACFRSWNWATFWLTWEKKHLDHMNEAGPSSSPVDVFLRLYFLVPQVPEDPTGLWYECPLNEFAQSKQHINCSFCLLWATTYSNHCPVC